MNDFARAWIAALACLAVLHLKLAEPRQVDPPPPFLPPQGCRRIRHQWPFWPRLSEGQPRSPHHQPSPSVSCCSLPRRWWRESMGRSQRHPLRSDVAKQDERSAIAAGVITSPVGTEVTRGERRPPEPSRAWRCPGGFQARRPHNPRIGKVRRSSAAATWLRCRRVRPNPS